VNVTATARRFICDETKTVDQDGGSDLVDIVAVSPDGMETVNATGLVSVSEWTSIPLDRFDELFSVQVRPVQYCSSWMFSRIFFEIKGAYEFRIRIGEVSVTDWVSSNVIRDLLTYNVL